MLIHKIFAGKKKSQSGLLINHMCGHVALFCKNMSASKQNMWAEFVFIHLPLETTFQKNGMDFKIITLGSIFVRTRFKRLFYFLSLLKNRGNIGQHDHDWWQLFVYILLGFPAKYVSTFFANIESYDICLAFFCYSIYIHNKHDTKTFLL